MLDLKAERVSGNVPPPRVADIEQWWTSRPPELSPRCRWWVDAFARGFRPNKRIAAKGYYSASAWYGVWIWEYINVLIPAWDGHATNRHRS